jgi:hypothetical protein
MRRSYPSAGVTNRGHDTIAVYSVNPAKGTLTPIEGRRQPRLVSNRSGSIPVRLTSSNLLIPNRWNLDAK